MAKSVLDACLLCLNKTHLQKSHLVPAAFYKHMRAANDKNSNPVIISEQVTLQTSKEVTGFAFCSHCEELLNKNWEDWILKNCFKQGQGFPLRERLLGSTPFESQPNVTAYAARNILGLGIVTRICGEAL